MVEFYHYLFYKSYLWQVKVMKEIDYPIYSAVIMICFVICLNYITVFDTVNYFVYHDRWPGKWNYWIPLTIILVFSYWYFTKNSRWKSVVKWGDVMPRIEKRERNIYYWIYIVISILLFLIHIYIVKENVFRLYPDDFTLPDNIHFIVR